MVLIWPLVRLVGFLRQLCDSLQKRLHLEPFIRAIECGMGASEEDDTGQSID